MGERVKFNLNTLAGRKAAWAWLVKTFGYPPRSHPPTPPSLDLIVTKDGVPFEDQAEGIRQFKAAALRRESVTRDRRWNHYGSKESSYRRQLTQRTRVIAVRCPRVRVHHAARRWRND